MIIATVPIRYTEWRGGYLTSGSIGLLDVTHHLKKALTLFMIPSAMILISTWQAGDQ